MATVSVENTTANLSGKTLVTEEGDSTVTGTLTYDRDPSAPFAVSAGSAKVTNLDADMVDGLHAADLGGTAVDADETITGAWTFTTDPTFNDNAIPETAIADGTLLARVADDETITGTWTFSNPPQTPAGTATVNAKQGGVLYGSASSVGNVGTGEDTLYTQDIAANSLHTDGDSLMIDAFGQYAGNATTKKLRFKWNGAAFSLSQSNTSDSGFWQARIIIMRRGATSQICSAMVLSNVTTNFATAQFATGSATLSGAVTFAITGEGASNNDITLEGVKINWLPAGA